MVKKLPSTPKLMLVSPLFPHLFDGYICMGSLADSAFVDFKTLFKFSQLGMFKVV